MRLFRRLLALFLALPSRASAFDRRDAIDRSGAAFISEKTRWQFPGMLLRRGGWMLLVALATLALGAMNASAYDLSGGASHTCALDDNGVTCWGGDGHGQTTVPAGLVNPNAVAAAYRHTCALDDNGVACWGAGEPGESGVYDYGQSTVPAGLVNPSAVAAGWDYTCAVDDNGVTCWGINEYGQTTVPVDLVFGSAPSVPALRPLGSVALISGLLGLGLLTSFQRTPTRCTGR